MTYEETVCHVFDSYCKTVLRNCLKDYYKEQVARRKYEMLAQAQTDTYTYDVYFANAHFFRVQEFCVPICRDDLVHALLRLPEDNRYILLLSCCVGLSDREIANRMHMIRRTVAYRRARTLLLMRGWLDVDV